MQISCIVLISLKYFSVFGNIIIKSCPKSSHLWIWENYCYRISSLLLSKVVERFTMHHDSLACVHYCFRFLLLCHHLLFPSLNSEKYNDMPYISILEEFIVFIFLYAYKHYFIPAYNYKILTLVCLIKMSFIIQSGWCPPKV